MIQVYIISAYSRRVLEIALKRQTIAKIFREFGLCQIENRVALYYGDEFYSNSCQRSDEPSFVFGDRRFYGWGVIIGFDNAQQDHTKPSTGVDHIRSNTRF